MLTIYCDNCEKEVEVKKDCICPFCKKDWTEEVIKEVDLDEVFDGVSKEDVENTVNFFLGWAKILKYFFLISALISVVSFIVLSFSNINFIFFVPLSLVPYGIGLILEHSLKWRAYMLYFNSKTKY